MMTEQSSLAPRGTEVELLSQQSLLPGRRPVRKVVVGPAGVES